MPITLDNTSITGLGVGGLPAGSVNATTLANGAVTRAKMGYAGAVLQVVQNFTTAVTTIAAGGTTQHLTQSITPVSASSQFLVMAYTSLGNFGSNPNVRMFLRRAISGGATTDVGSFTEGIRKGGLSGVQINEPNNPEAMLPISAQFLDSPSTASAITYGIVIGTEDGGVIVNRVQRTDNAVWATRTHTTIIIMEIAA